MSRSSIANDKGIVSRLQKYLDLEDSHVITFMNQNIGELHFGNTEGSNSLEGEDILVVGTPYHANFLYELIAFYLGYDVSPNEPMKLQTIIHNGYKTTFTTYSDEDLRNIQFWMIESELEQAVGRARLLRHDCNVHLFSTFPLRQAKIINELPSELKKVFDKPLKISSTKKKNVSPENS